MLHRVIGVLMSHPRAEDELKDRAECDSGAYIIVPLVTARSPGVTVVPG
jgi:hypothetical protein